MPKAGSEEEGPKKANVASKIKKRHAAGTWLLTPPLTFESRSVVVNGAQGWVKEDIFVDIMRNL